MSSPQLQSAALNPEPEPPVPGSLQAAPLFGTTAGQVETLPPPAVEVEPPLPPLPPGPAPELPPASASCLLVPPQANVVVSSHKESVMLRRMATQHSASSAAYWSILALGLHYLLSRKKPS